jgi:ribosomal protein L30
MARKLRVEQIKGYAATERRTRRILDALGLGKVGKVKTFEEPNAALIGMLKRVEHMIYITEVK